MSPTLLLMGPPEDMLCLLWRGSGTRLLFFPTDCFSCAGLVSRKCGSCLALTGAGGRAPNGKLKAAVSTVAVLFA